MDKPKPKKSERIELDFSGEAAVQAALGGIPENVQQAIDMSPKERARTDKEMARVRQYVDIPEDLKKLIQRMAKQLKTSESQVFCWLAVRGAKYTSIEEMTEELGICHSMRFPNTLPTPKAPVEIPRNRRR